MDPVSSQTKYVISLDAIDLNYIPTVNRYTGNEVTQIWTKENLNQRNNEYFEFEIKENNLEFNDVTDDCANAQYTHVTCHICNIDVPKPFLKEHFYSKKHKTFKKIIDISLDRLKRMIDLDVFEDTNISDSVYFCTSCVSAIQINQKILHEKSLAHKNALMVEKFLNDFLDLYDDRKESSNDCDNDSNVRKESGYDLSSSNMLLGKFCDNDNSNIQYTNKVLLNNDKVPIVNNAAVHDQMKIKDLTLYSNNKALKIESIPSDITAAPTVDDFKTNLMAYIDFLINTTNLKNIKVLQNNNLEIETISGAKVKIIERKFNSIVNQSRSLYCCKLCSKIIHKNQKWDHLYEKKHVQRVTIPFENEHCMRLIDNTWSHCALCNTEVQNREDHVSTDKNHKLLLDKALQNNTESVADECPGGAVVAASTSKQNSNDIKENNVKDDHKTQFINFFQNIEFDYLLDLSNNVSNDYICRVCKSLITSNYNKVKEHMNSANHTENYTKLLSCNNITKCTEDSFHCSACQTTVAKKVTLIHINDQRHQQNLASAIEAEKQKAKPIVFKKSIEPDTFLLKLEGNSIKDNSFNCAICSMSVPNHNFNIYTHLATASHINSATKLPSDSTIGMHYHIDLTNFPIITCMVCDVRLTLHEKNMITHIKGNNHKQNYKLKLEDNQIVKNSNNYFCTICSISISPNNELIHCQTKKHIQKLNEINSSMTNDSESGTSETGTPETGTPETDKSQSGMSETDSLAEIEEKKYLLLNFGESNHLFCVVCNTKVPNNSNNIRTHLKGFKHLQLYKGTLDNNYIVNVCDDFECKLCNMFIVTGKEFIHISTKKHEDKIKSSMKFKCVVCQVILTKNDDNIRVHDSGEQHKQMVELAAKNNIRINEDKCFCETCEKYIDNENIGTHLNNVYHVMHSFCKCK